MTKITLNTKTPTTSINTSTIAHLTSSYNDFDLNDPESVEEESKSSILIYAKAGPELAANYKMAKGYVGPVMSVDSHNLKKVSSISKIINISAPCIAPDHPEVGTVQWRNHTYGFEQKSLCRYGKTPKTSKMSQNWPKMAQKSVLQVWQVWQEWHPKPSLPRSRVGSLLPSMLRSENDFGFGWQKP